MAELMCPKCRHAGCYSQGIAGGEVLPCVFCEDGLPCIEQRRHPLSAIAPAAVRQEAKPEVPAAAGESEESVSRKFFSFKPKACESCGEEFTPTGARSTKCEDCRTKKPLDGGAVSTKPRRKKKARSEPVQTPAVAAGEKPATEEDRKRLVETLEAENLRLESHLAKFTERAWQRLSLAQKCVALEAGEAAEA